MTTEERALIEEIREQNREILSLLRGGPVPEPLEVAHRREDLAAFARNPELMKTVFGGRKREVRHAR
jgi:hypothetical protein